MRVLLPILAIVVALCAPSVAPSSPANKPPDAGVADQRLLSYDEARASGLPVPVIDPSLPICREDLVADGFTSVEEMEAAVDNAKAACQADPTNAVVRVGEPRAAEEAPGP
jgi:hypothetical protein